MQYKARGFWNKQCERAIRWDDPELAIDWPLDQLEAEGVRWAREVLQHSPTAIRCLKAAFNAETDGLAGIQELAGQATHLFYRTDEAQEGRDAFLGKRPPDFSGTGWLP